jgi:hypothetical protein
VIRTRLAPDGAILIAGQPSGLRSDRPPGEVTVAAWATAVRLGPPEDRGLEARVEQVAPGPGRWEVVLAGDEGLRAHLPLSEPPPAAGDRCSVTVDPALATLLAG